MATEIAARSPSPPCLLTSSSAAGYERHRPEETALHTVVREQLETFLARAREDDRPAPRFIEQELRAYLRCGILAHGFLRLHCDACGHDRLVPFSCKRRGFCPSCGGRRMADTAAHLVDCVLPEVPIRQWVLTLPYPLRYRCAYDAALTTEILRRFLRALFSALRRRAKGQWGTPRGRCGAVTFIQRFGSALNLNVHFHTLALDGVYAGGDGTTARFLPLPPPSPDEVARVLAGTARRIARLVESRADGDDDALARDEPLLATLSAASLRSRIAMGPGAGQRWRRLGDRVEPHDPEPDPEASPRIPQHDGMSLHADVATPARDRRRLERLCRYVARPPLAHGRLELRPDGRLALRLKTRWRDGTTHILMERHELLERLVPLIPPPRAHQVRYHGVLAPCASARDRVVLGPRPPRAAAELQAPIPEEHHEPARLRPWDPKERCHADDSVVIHPGLRANATRPARSHARAGPVRGDPGATDHRDSGWGAASDCPRPRRIPWAELLQRVF
ncbi:MAG: transposase, partial [Thermoleophilia bacterium]|nr:transposase [Thermoleophilia bacterium]